MRASPPQASSRERKLHSKAATVYKRAMADKFEAERGIGALSAIAALVATAHDAPSLVVENAELSRHGRPTRSPVTRPRNSYLQFAVRALRKRERNWNLAGPTGLEPATSGVTGQRSNQLNYDPARAVNIF